MATQIVVHDHRPTVTPAAGELHNIRGSLAVIRGQCHAIVRAGRASDGTIDRLRCVDGEVERIVLAIERVRRALEGEDVTPSAVTVDLAGLVHEAGDRHEGVAGERSIALGCVTDPGRQLVSACADEMRRVVDNLVLNAIAASAHGGTVLVRLTRRGSWVRLSVSDGGGADRPRSGWGMGLRIVEAIVARHGGSVTFGRRATRTVVTVMLPVHDPWPGEVA